MNNFELSTDIETLPVPSDAHQMISDDELHDDISQDQLLQAIEMDDGVEVIGFAGEDENLHRYDKPEDIDPLAYSDVVQQSAWLAYRYVYNLGKYEFGDMVQWGWIGLMQAIQRYDYSAKGNFAAYAYRTMFGAIMQEVSRSDILAPYQRSKLRIINRANLKLQADLGRKPRTKEVADEIGITVAKLIRWEAETTRFIGTIDTQPNNDDDDITVDPPDTSPGPLALAMDAALKAKLRSTMETMPLMVKKAIVGHYIDGRPTDTLVKETGMTKYQIAEKIEVGLQKFRTQVDGLGWSADDYLLSSPIGLEEMHN